MALFTAYCAENEQIHPLLKDWPTFKWEDDKITLLSSVRHKQGRLPGKLDGLGFRWREETTLEMLTQDVIKSSEIEGEKLPS